MSCSCAKAKDSTKSNVARESVLRDVIGWIYGTDIAHVLSLAVLPEQVAAADVSETKVEIAERLL